MCLEPPNLSSVILSCYSRTDLLDPCCWQVTRQGQRGDTEGDSMKVELLLGVGGQHVLPVSGCTLAFLRVIPDKSDSEFPLTIE